MRRDRDTDEGVAGCCGMHVEGYLQCGGIGIFIHRDVDDTVLVHLGTVRLLCIQAARSLREQERAPASKRQCVREDKTMPG